MNWVTSIMKRIGKQTLIEHYLVEENCLTNNQDLPNEVFQRKLDYQTIYMKEMIKNTSQTN